MRSPNSIEFFSSEIILTLFTSLSSNDEGRCDSLCRDFRLLGERSERSERSDLVKLGVHRRVKLSRVASQMDTVLRVYCPRAQLVRVDVFANEYNMILLSVSRSQNSKRFRNPESTLVRAA